MNAPWHGRRVRRYLRASLLPAVIAAFALLAGCAGCGDEAIETDPTVDTGFEELDTTTPGERAFDNTGDTLDQKDTDASDIDALAAQLGDVFFGYDQFDLDAEDRDLLGRNAKLLRDNPKVKILLEGHCDERGTSQYNMALGEKRAETVKRYLVSLQIAADRIETVSYGKERPFAFGTGEANWSQNRRAHFVIRSTR